MVVVFNSTSMVPEYKTWLFYDGFLTYLSQICVMPSPGQSALKFLRSNLRRGQKPKVRIAVLGQASVGKTGKSFFSGGKYNL